MTPFDHYWWQYLDLGISYQLPILEDGDEVPCHGGTPHAISFLPLPTSLPTSHTHAWCTHTHTYALRAHTHTHAHTCIYTRVHTHACTCIHTCTQIHIDTYTLTRNTSSVCSSPSCDCDEINMHASVFLPASQILFPSFLLPFSLSSWINTSSNPHFSLPC